VPEDDASARSASRPHRPLWDDRWLIGAFRRLGHAGVERLDDMAETAWEGLVRAGVSPEQILETVCAMGHATPADLTVVSADQAALLDRALARRHTVVPLALIEGALEVATANPLLPNLEQDLAFATGFRVRLKVASPPDIRRLLALLYPLAGRGLA
jgi:hypothetical protein